LASLEVSFPSFFPFLFKKMPLFTFLPMNSAFYRFPPSWFIRIGGALITGTLGLMGCRQAEEGDLVPLPTSVCLQTMHHDVPVPEVNVFFKFNCDTFPGYHQSADWFDTLVVSDALGKACISPVAPGKHWAVAFGASEHGLLVPIYGRFPFEINLDTRIKVDTFLFMYE
jgi:hypothetical protein